jgi:hypothetical protein
MAVSEPAFVQVRVRVTGFEVVGYQGWLGSMAAPVPEREMPESPVGDVSTQAVALVEVQL